MPEALSTPVRFATGGLGGVLGWIVVHPANTAAVRLNLASQSSAVPVSFPQFISQLAKEKKLMSLYDGLSAGVARQVVYATARLGLFEVIRDELAKYRPTDIYSRLVSGCVSGGIASLMACPIEVSLVRLSNDTSLPIDKRRNYKGVLDALGRIFVEEGPKTFFNGSGPMVNRAMMVGAVQVGSLDQFKAMYKDYGITSKFGNVFAASMSSGLLYSVVTMPLESAKNRMAFQKPDSSGQLPYRSTIQTIGSVAGKEGVLKLWTGFLPYYIRCGGHTVCMFVAMEYIRSMLM